MIFLVRTLISLHINHSFIHLFIPISYKLFSPLFSSFCRKSNLISFSWRNFFYLLLYTIRKKASTIYKSMISSVSIQITEELRIDAKSNHFWHLWTCIFPSFSMDFSIFSQVQHTQSLSIFLILFLNFWFIIGMLDDE